MQNKEFGSIISRLINGEDLSYSEAKSAFTQILNNETSEMQQGAFLAALNAKRETKEEVAGSWEAIYEIDTVKVDIDVDEGIVDNCGTGMDSFKTFNISTAASVIAAAAGVKMARHGARALSSVCGTVDIAEALGVDVECSADLVTKSILEAGIGLYNGMSPEIHPMALGRILSQIHFGTTLNISASLANPALPGLGVRGVYNRQMIMPVIEIMKEIGYKRALVIHGTIDGTDLGMDEASVCGNTFGAELLSDGTINKFNFSPADINLPVHAPDLLAPESSIDESALSFLKLLTGKAPQVRMDAVLLNTSLVLYIAGITDNFSDGVELAESLIREGTVLEALKLWVKTQNRDPEAGKAKLDYLLSRV